MSLNQKGLTNLKNGFIGGKLNMKRKKTERNIFFLSATNVRIKIFSELLS